MDIEQRGLHAAMSRERCDLVNVPACASEVSQAKVPERMRCEALNAGSPSEMQDNLRPTPYRDRLGVVAARLGEKQRTALLAQRTAVLKILQKQFTA
jgi:hypothetical protein